MTTPAPHHQHPGAGTEDGPAGHHTDSDTGEFGTVEDGGAGQRAVDAVTSALTSVLPLHVAAAVLRGDPRAVRERAAAGGGGDGWCWEADQHGVAVWWQQPRSGGGRRRDPDLTVTWRTIVTELHATANPGVCAALTHWQREWRWLHLHTVEPRSGQAAWWRPRHRAATDAAARIQQAYVPHIAAAVLAQLTPPATAAQPSLF